MHRLFRPQDRKCYRLVTWTWWLTPSTCYPGECSSWPRARQWLCLFGRKCSRHIFNFLSLHICSASATTSALSHLAPASPSNGLRPPCLPHRLGKWIFIDIFTLFTRHVASRPGSPHRCHVRHSLSVRFLILGDVASAPQSAGIPLSVRGCTLQTDRAGLKARQGRFPPSAASFPDLGVNYHARLPNALFPAL